MAKTDGVLDRMTDFFTRKGSPVIVKRLNKGYSIFHESGEPAARFRPQAANLNQVEVLWWSSRNKWDYIGDFGGMVMGLEEALEYVLSDPMEIFRIGRNRGLRNVVESGLSALLGKLFYSSR